MVTAGQFTVTVASSVLSASLATLPAETVTVFVSGPQVTPPLPPMALPVTTMTNEPGAVTSPKEHVRTLTSNWQSSPGLVVIVQPEVFAGRTSFSITL
jgi:hypothetical protein